MSFADRVAGGRARARLSIALRDTGHRPQRERAGACRLPSCVDRDAVRVPRDPHRYRDAL